MTFKNIYKKHNSGIRHAALNQVSPYPVFDQFTVYNIRFPQKPTGPDA